MFKILILKYIWKYFISNVSDKSYSAEAFLIPKLSDSGLSFEDIKWEGSPASVSFIYS